MAVRRARFFSDAEFWCQCHRPECDALREVSQELLTLLDEIRADVARPLRVTSGLRCGWWNAHERGAPDSAHPDGTEADLACATSALRYAILASAYRHGAPRIGIGPTFVHIGTSDRLAHGVAWTYYPLARAAALLPDDPRVC